MPRLIELRLQLPSARAPGCRRYRPLRGKSRSLFLSLLHRYVHSALQVFGSVVPRSVKGDHDDGRGEHLTPHHERRSVCLHNMKLSKLVLVVLVSMYYRALLDVQFAGGQTSTEQAAVPTLLLNEQGSISRAEIAARTRGSHKAFTSSSRSLPYIVSRSSASPG
jgi:hypothetical protein